MQTRTSARPVRRANRHCFAIGEDPVERAGSMYHPFNARKSLTNAMAAPGPSTTAQTCHPVLLLESAGGNAIEVRT